MYFWGRENVLLKATLTVLAESVLESFIHFAHFNLTKDLQMSTTLLWAFGQFLSQIPAKSISISLLGQHFSLFRPVGLNLTAPLSNHFKRGFFDCTVSGVIHADLHKSIFLVFFFFLITWCCYSHSSPQRVICVLSVFLHWIYWTWAADDLLLSMSLQLSSGS